MKSEYSYKYSYLLFFALSAGKDVRFIFDNAKMNSSSIYQKYGKREVKSLRSKDF